MKCPSCNGRGRIEHGMFEIACSICCGTGEIQNKERKTNFDRITESPEALAEFLRSVRCYCDYIHNCKKCPTGCKNGGWLGWLQEKYHE